MCFADFFRRRRRLLHVLLPTSIILLRLGRGLPYRVSQREREFFSDDFSHKIAHFLYLSGEDIFNIYNIYFLIL